MSPQTETKASVEFKVGVKEYKLTYYTPEYKTKDTDILAEFRVTPQPGVPPEEVGAVIAAESFTGTVVGKHEGERDITLGFVDLLRDDFIVKDQSRGIYFTQDWVSLPSVIPLASGGIHVWHMPALTEIFGVDYVLQFGGGTLGHPWGNAPGAIANRVALEV